MGREIVMLREAVEAATLRCAAAEDRATEETRTLRQQLENAVSEAPKAELYSPATFRLWHRSW